jgi:conjugative relaxase-like TrwC/TraI family protein
VISIRRISLGGGFRYLMESVAVGDGAGGRCNDLARYYSESGTPPGVFLGAGLADLDGGRGVQAGSQVTEEHMANMLVSCADPVSGEPLGSAPRAPRGAAPVAGFDLTFSPSKSVSVAWALADEGTKAVILRCHRLAVEYVLGWAEAEVFRSRSGTDGVVEEDVTGVVAASFTHWSSRADDPQLHDHVVIWNRARSTSDGRWRTLDSRAIFKATTTLSELHQGVLSDLLTGALGVGWEPRARRHSTKLRFEILGVAEALMAEFSRRADQIAARTEQLRSDFAAVHGRAATAVEDMRLHQQATVATRPHKSHTSLAELTDRWRSQAHPHVRRAAQVAWVSGLKDRNDLPLLRADGLGAGMLDDAAQAVLAEVSERQATFTRMNVLAEAHRILHGVRFATPDDRETVAATLTAMALDRSLSLAPPELCHTPARYRRPDGTSRLRPQARTVYTTRAVLDAEARLVEAGRTVGGPVMALDVLSEVADADLAGRANRLSLDQAVAVETIATSGRVLDVLVGPAGTGKSTTMAGLRAAWEAEHGLGSVIGLAPSAAAAEALGDELGIGTDNTAKWLTEWRRIPTLTARRDQLTAALARHHDRRSAAAHKLHAAVADLDRAIDARRLHAGQLVIIDEAGMAGTFALDEITAAARHGGAKVLLVGDWAQLSAVDAGGAFDLVVRDRGDLAPELTEVRRFRQGWEKVASAELRLGHLVAIDAYQTHGRVAGGERHQMLDALYRAWKADVEAGRSALMIAHDAATVAELNARARADRVTTGQVATAGLTIGDGQVAGVGDEVLTRENNRLLATGRRWVKNGDRWKVTATKDDGSMAVRRLDGTGEVVLPADYAARHLELAYATTGYRAQGRTVDIAHAMVSPTTTREALYVAATRGRDANHLYVDVAFDPDPATSHDGVGPTQTARGVLETVLARGGAEMSAHETLRLAHQAAEDFTALVHEYQTIAREAEQQRWDHLLRRCGLALRDMHAVQASAAYGPLMACLRDAEACGLDVETALPRLVAARPFDDADDPGAVLHGRLDRWADAAGRKRQAPADLIAGLIPRAAGISDPDLAQALHDRDHAMQRRARAITNHAIERGQIWVRRLGVPPVDPTRREAWLRAVTTVAAYRDRWNIGTVHQPLGPETVVKSIEAIGHRRRAQAAVEHALWLSDSASIHDRPTGSTITAWQSLEKEIGL